MSSHYGNRVVAIAVLFLAAGHAQQNAPEQDYKSPAVLRATTRLVVVDVVATDSKGAPVGDLGIDDFTVLEDDKPQKVSGFSFRQSSTVTELKQQARLNLFSNVPRFAGASSLNVILLDSLNAEYLSRTYGRDQLLKYLESAPAIQPTAIYALEDRLKLLHDFSVDAKELRAVVENYKPNAPTRVVDVYSAATPYSRSGDYTLSSRTLETTVSSLGALAQILAGHPGRKNLIWISAAFPLTMYPANFHNAPNNAIDRNGEGTTNDTPLHDIDTDNIGMQGSRTFNDQVERVANAMMNAQVAIYPVDCSGVSQNSRANAASTMRLLAERTGGKTYVNRNDIDMAVRTSLNDGATYYTLEYYPQNKSWDGKFRVIQVKTERGGVRLRYRQGYYALNPEQKGEQKKDGEKDLAHLLGEALSPDMPAATGVLFQAGVVPPTEKGMPVTVNFAIDPHTVAFERANDGFVHASLSCAVVAYSEKGSLVKKEINSLTAALKTPDFEKLMQGYFPCKRTIELKPGHYNLTLGVVDQGSRLIGTTTASVSVP
ncbi:MAG TPA: VWA domain-containing protein [Candidatus Angelobacter sp.]|nr:VWA domain-containing protein [Candidatus Angelobacter sp.]